MAGSKRIFVAGIATETHGFNKFPTTLEAFTERGLWFIDEHESLERFRGGGPLVGQARVQALSDGQFMHRGAYMRDMHAGRPGAYQPKPAVPRFARHLQL